MYMCTLRPGYDGCVLVCVLRDGGGGGGGREAVSHVHSGQFHRSYVTSSSRRG